MRKTAIASVLVSLGLLAAGCSVNPATGQRQLTLIGEQQEIAMGQAYDKQIVAEMGLYPDEDLQRYIDGIGQRMAALSERPHLPWIFRVVDDPTVNAFAVPGGHIYITRGIMAHSGSEAQLASVIGHEIGHVTARHSVEQMSRAQLAQLGFGVAVIASEEFREYAGVAQLGMQALFMKFSRDDERQSDDLGLRYLTRGGFDPHEMPKMFEMLSRQSDLHGGRRLPSWQSTHPDPDRRGGRIRRQIEALPPDAQSGTVNDAAYLRRLQDMIFGLNPREGYTIGSSFFHPDMKFRIDFPKGWKVINQKQSVAAVSPNQDSVVVLTLAKGMTVQEAAAEFFKPQSIEQGRRLRQGFFDFRTVPEPDPRTGATPEVVQGSVRFVPHGDSIIRLISYASKADWPGRQKTARASLSSFRKLTVKRFLDVRPARLRIVELKAPMTLSQFHSKHPSTITLKQLAVLNGVPENHRFERGELVKRVVGGQLPKK